MDNGTIALTIVLGILGVVAVIGVLAFLSSFIYFDHR